MHRQFSLANLSRTLDRCIWRLRVREDLNCSLQHNQLRRAHI